MIKQSRKLSIFHTFLTRAELSIILAAANISSKKTELWAVRREFLTAIRSFLIEANPTKNDQDRWKMTQSRVDFQSIIARIATVQKSPFSDIINDAEQNRPYIVFLATLLNIWSEMVSKPTFGRDKEGGPTRSIRFALACFRHLGENIDPSVLDEMARKIWLGGIRLKPSEIPNIVWDHHRHKESFWPQKRTWKPVVELLQRTAKSNRQQSDRDATKNAVLVVNCPISHLSHEIHAIVRRLRYAKYARTVTQVDVPLLGTGKKRRQIEIRWDKQAAGAQQQIKKLEKAAANGSKYKWEKTWLSLTDGALNLLGKGHIEAMKQGALKGFKGRPQVTGTIIPSTIPAPGFVQIIIPFALAIGARKDRPRHEIKDQVMADLVQIYMEASGRSSDGLIRGGHNKPFGEGANFIQQIETLFDIKLMPTKSVHAIRRARKLLNSQTSD